MITRFDSLFAGYMDGKNIGYGGTPINQRRYGDAHLSSMLWKAQSIAKTQPALAK